MRLKGKTCLVTGAARGIGRSIAERFVAEGADVLATDRDEAALEALAPHPRLRRRLLDITAEDQVSAVVAASEPLDILVNCAGYVAAGAALECSPEDFRRSFTINVESIYLTTRAVLPGMIARRSGALVNIASVASTIMAPADRFAYGASKAAVIAMTMSVARDYAGFGIRCNAISPGTIDTPSLQDRMQATGDAVAARAAFEARQLVGRLGRPEEVAAAAVLLASDEAPFMTGANLVIDGGMSL